MPLLPPRVVGPLSECSSAVKVEAQLTGSTVTVRADGAVVASGVATGPSQVFALTAALGSGQQVTATQTIGMDTSAPSPDPVMVQKKPPTIGMVSYRSHLHVCGGCLWLEGLVPGATVEVTGNGGFRGSGDSYDGNARVGLNGPIAAGEALTATQKACGELGKPTPGATPDFPGGLKEGRHLPPPEVEGPLRACQKGVVVKDVFDGARVTLLRSGGPNLQACFDVSRLRFHVNPGLVEGETVIARQDFPACHLTSVDSAPVLVGPAEPVPPPEVEGPLCVGATSVRLNNLLYGSRVRILYDGAEIGMAEVPEDGSYDFPVPPLPAPSPHGGLVAAQQELCGIWSDPSNAVEVGPVPATLPTPEIPGPLFECGAAVYVKNLHPGARVYVISSMLGAPVGEMQVYATEAVVPVAPLLVAGDTITAHQVGCGKQSAAAPGMTVQPLARLRPPKVVAPVYDCFTKVAVAGAAPGARIEVYVNDAWRGTAIAGPDPTEVPIIGALQAGDRVQARQRLCDQVTPLGEPVIVEHFDGRWITIGGNEKAEILAVHAALLRTNKIMYFGGDQHTSSLNQNGDVDHTRLFDCNPPYDVTPVTGLPASADLFCAGHAQLADGRILVGGGTHAWGLPAGEDPHGHGPLSHFIGSREAWLFDPADHQWHRTGPLVTQRPGDPALDPGADIERTGGKWYPTLVTLSDGRVLAVSGHPRELDTRHNNDTLERYDAGAGAWMPVGATDSSRIPRSVGRTLEYPRMFVLPDGRVLSVTSLQGGDLWIWAADDDPNAWMHLTSPRPGYGGNPLSHTAVLLPLRPQEKYRARVLLAGESTAWVLDPAGPTLWHATARVLSGHPGPGDVNPRRANLDAVILPTGEVFIEGGAKDGNSDSTGVKQAEMFDPEDTAGSVAGTWRVLPEAQEVRNYHSVALLMPNGAVWVAGSNIDSKTGLGNRNRWIEIFEPWYFCHPRPRIQSAPERVCAGETFTIRTPHAGTIQRVVLVRAGTCTHNFNPDQRLIELTFRFKAPDLLVAVAPPNSHLAIPGYYLLFVLNGRRVPSTGRFIQICPPRRRFRFELDDIWLEVIRWVVRELRQQRVVFTPLLLALLKALDAELGGLKDDEALVHEAPPAEPHGAREDRHDHGHDADRERKHGRDHDHGHNHERDRDAARRRQRDE
jgi:hypothetical protein